MKIERNAPCWCGSGRKYKVCHLAVDEKMEAFRQQGKMVPDHEMIKNRGQIEGIREAGKLNNEILDMISEQVKEGISTGELDRLAHEYTVKHGGIPAPLGYEGFPKSICTSVNEVVCHGIPDENRILCSGDILNIDITTIKNGYYADASRMYCLGNVDEKAGHLVRTAKACLDFGAAAVKPWGFLGDIGYAVYTHARENGYSVVEEIGGHGVGLEFHEEPWVSHIGQPGTDILLVPGMIFTIEPMLNMGAADVIIDETDGWTVRTSDGKLSAQWEYTILVTENGCELLAW